MRCPTRKLVAHLARDHSQRVFLLGRQGSGLLIDDAERPERIARVAKQWRAGVKTDIGFTVYQRVAGEAWIVLGVLYDGQAGLENSVGAKRHLARHFPRDFTQNGFAPLSFGIHQSNGSDRRSADKGGETREIIECLLREGYRGYRVRRAPQVGRLRCLAEGRT